MKYLSHILLFIVLVLSSCDKIIDLNLDDDKQRTVIDSKLLSGTHDFDVRLEKSGNYFGAGSIKDITDATVSIFDGTNSHELSNLGNGEYRLPEFTTYENQEYKLSVEENGATHEASAEMVSLVTLDTLVFEYVEAIFEGEEDGYRAYIDFQDPIDDHNYYMIETRVNGDDEKEGFDVFDDEFVNGNQLFFSVEESLQENDIIEVDLISINKETYDYYSQLQMAIFGDGAAPTNPDNNFGKDVLGNFSIMAVSTIVAVVQ